MAARSRMSTGRKRAAGKNRLHALDIRETPRNRLEPEMAAYFGLGEAF